MAEATGERFQDGSESLQPYCLYVKLELLTGLSSWEPFSARGPEDLLESFSLGARGLHASLPLSAWEAGQLDETGAKVSFFMNLSSCS